MRELSEGLSSVTVAMVRAKTAPGRAAVLRDEAKIRVEDRRAAIVSFLCVNSSTAPLNIRIYFGIQSDSKSVCSLDVLRPGPRCHNQRCVVVDADGFEIGEVAILGYYYLWCGPIRAC